MLKFISINILFLALVLQNSEGQKIESASIEPKPLTLAIGTNLAPFVIQLTDHSRKGFNVTGRMGFKRNWFAVAELGYENVDYKSTNYNYASNGTGLKIGIDYNVFSPQDADNNDNILFGCRYGAAWQQQSSSSYTVVNDYWGNYTANMGQNGLVSHFAEISFGIRTEVFTNFYMGLSVQGRGLIYSKNSGVLEPTSIPEYGKPNPINFGFSYNLEYQLPNFGKKSKK